MTGHIGGGKHGWLHEQLQPLYVVEDFLTSIDLKAKQVKTLFNHQEV